MLIQGNSLFPLDLHRIQHLLRLDPVARMIASACTSQPDRVRTSLCDLLSSVGLYKLNVLAVQTSQVIRVYDLRYVGSAPRGTLPAQCA